MKKNKPSAKEHTSPTLDEIIKYDNIGRNIQSKAIFSFFFFLKKWLIGCLKVFLHKAKNKS